MTQVEADIDVLTGLRQGVLAFAGRQHDALSGVQQEIAYTERALEEAERHWRREIDARQDRLHACLIEAAFAAAEGYYVDCSAQEYALREAEEGLVRVLECRRQVSAMVTYYQPMGARVGDLLASDVPRATTFLANRIAALEAYHAARVQSTSLALAGAGVLAVMGGVMGAIRLSQGELRRVMGPAGEQVAAQVLTGRFGLQELPFDQPAHGFDRVFSAPGMPLIVVESKVSSSGDLHLGQTQAGEQGSAGWVGSTAAQMTDRESAQWSPANERIGGLVQELGAENVPVLVVVVKPSSGLSDVYARQASGAWALVQGSLTPDQVLPSVESASGPATPPEQREGAQGGAERRG